MLNEPPPNLRSHGHGLYTAGLLLGRHVGWLRTGRGIRTIVDLTEAARPAVANACRRKKVAYVKLPTPPDTDPDVTAAGRLELPVLVFCYHGRDRALRFAREWLRPC